MKYKALEEYPFLNKIIEWSRRTRSSEVRRVKLKLTYLQYITDTRNGWIFIIPNSDKQGFITVSGSYPTRLTDKLFYERFNLI